MTIPVQYMSQEVSAISASDSVSLSSVSHEMDKVGSVAMGDW